MPEGAKGAIENRYPSNVKATDQEVDQGMGLLKDLKEKARTLKRQTGALYYASTDQRVGLLPKIIIGAAILYALNPIDIIPDFIPVIGYLDDLIVLPVLIALAIRLIPENQWQEALQKAEEKPVVLKKRWVLGVFTVTIWVIVVIWLTRLVLHLIR